MRIEQIEIKGGAADAPESISTLAIADDYFAIHPTGFGAIGWDENAEAPAIAFTLTHRPTGYAVVTGRSWVEVLGYWSEIKASAMDWNISDPESVRKQMGPEFRRIRKSVESRIVVPA